jgi:hypothetical protein
MVIKPVQLRDRIAGEARRLASLYGWKVHRTENGETGEDDHQFFSDFFGE